MLIVHCSAFHAFISIHLVNHLRNGLSMFLSHFPRDPLSVPGIGMATTTTRHPLTKRNLAILDRLLQNKHTSETITSWAEKVISEEQIHLLCTQPATSLDDMHPPAGDDATYLNVERDMDIFVQPARSLPPVDTTRTDVDSSKVIEVDVSRPFMCLESPLERYLTPGSSEPSHFSRSALAHVGLQFGDMEGKKERAEIARGHVEVARDNALQAREQAGK
ncbi:uncharacterized protein BDW70DRAFT_65162 [Aspergillus foveolatus]|uniref:uncharacterized protein n=1 Tax=Aspergillus foveolatus TaxID=210207 RepID=UPI003CCDABE2